MIQEEPNEMNSTVFIVYGLVDCIDYERLELNSVFNSRDEAEKHRALIENEVQALPPGRFSTNCKKYYRTWVDEVEVKDKSNSKTVLYCDLKEEDYVYPENSPKGTRWADIPGVIVLKDSRYEVIPKELENLRADDVCGVQTMNGPRGLIFTTLNNFIL